jgi:preprotein translocase subunit YajC
MQFIQQYGLIILLAVLLVFMFWSSRRRQQRQKAEQEAKAKQTLPGAEVMLQGGLYGTIVEYDAENLDQPAIVEIAPGVDIKVHSQAILRVVSPTEQPGAHEAIDDEHVADAPHVETPEETTERLKGENDSDQK